MGFVTALVIGAAVAASVSYYALAAVLISSAYQIRQAKKLREKQGGVAASDARKGFELVVDKSAEKVPIIYGRALVGGTRVYHNVASNYRFNSTVNANKVFDVGPNPTGNFQLSFVVNGQVQTINIPAQPGALLDRFRKGSKNEFLFFQQVLCHGPIQGVYDFVVDETRYSNDPSLGFFTGGSYTGNNEIKAAFRAELMYDGGVSNLMKENFEERATASFPGLAYANVVIKLDKDDPQFGGSVPQVQFFIEGRKVRKVLNGSLSSTRVYSNNPAWVLLDYLLKSNDRPNAFDPGKGLDSSEIDLASFELAAAICDRTVATKPVAGNVWRSFDGQRNVTTRQIPLYECNIVLDPETPIRENIEKILATMGDARLVWSQGKYKLSLLYPLVGAL